MPRRFPLPPPRLRRAPLGAARRPAVPVPQPASGPDGSRPTRSRGFTLIELLIAVAIVGILATIALPSYRDQMRKSRRAEAQAFAMSVAARQMQFLVDTRAYSASLADIGVPTPTSVTAAYDVALAVAAAPPTFSITLTPIGEQGREACGTLRIDQTGNKTATRDGVAASGCW